MTVDMVAFTLDARGARRQAIACAGGVLACIAALAFTTEDTPAWVAWAAWVGAIALSVVAAVQVIRAFDKRPVIVLDSWGVADRRALVSAPWTAIHAARLHGRSLTGRPRWIALDVSDPAEAHGSALGRSRTLHRLAGQVGAPSVLLDLDGLAGSPAEIIAAMRRFKPDLG